jgi:aryl-alcohol dehydrogenase-like predicted oxidoreductase
MKALGVSHYQHLERYVSLQAYYTIAGRDLERELVPLLLDQKVGLMVWSPLAGGFLSGKYTRENQQAEGGRRSGAFDFPPVNKELAFNIIDRLRPMAETKGSTVASLALAWLLHQAVVSTVIIGAKKMDQLEDNLKAVDVQFTPEELKELDEVSKLAPEYPGWMLGMTGGDRQV